MSPVKKYEEHIADICFKHDIVVGTHSSGGRAFKKSRRINIRPIKSSITYAVALHEIGHILGPDQSKTRLEKEAGAWLWAKANATEWTEPMQKKMVQCLKSYARWSERHMTMKAPPKDHAFWTLQNG